MKPKEPVEIFGARRHQRRVLGAFLSETHYRSGEILQEHFHPNPYVCFVLEGCIFEDCGDGAAKLVAGSMVFRPAKERHADRFRADTRCFNLEFGPGSLEHPVLPPSTVQTRLEKTGPLVSRIHRLFRSPDRATLMATQHLIDDLLARLFSSSPLGKTRRDLLGETLEILLKNLTNPPSLSEMAGALSIHPVYLTRVFRLRTGKSIGTFLSEARIAKAKARLENTNVPLTELALSLGFADHSHFSRTFKRRTGVSPATFRKLFQK